MALWRGLGAQVHLLTKDSPEDSSIPGTLKSLVPALSLPWASVLVPQTPIAT